MDLHYLTISLLYFLSGATLGSFLNVIILRIPNKMSIVHPKSHCFNCNNPIPFYYNIPIISYLILRGRCNKCHSSISKQYIIVEIIMGILLCIILNNLNIPQSMLLTIVFSCFVIIGGIDYKYLLIPRSIIIILFVALIIKPFIFEQSFIDIAFGSVLLMLYMSVLIFFVGIIKKNFKLIGLGDIILLIMIGGWFGVINSYICLFISSVIGISITKIPFIKYHNDNKIPFGFCLSASFIIVSLLVDCYKIELFTF